MTEIPFATNGDIRIAYTDMGEGPLDLILAPAWASDIDVYPEDARAAAPRLPGVMHGRVWAPLSPG